MDLRKTYDEVNKLLMQAFIKWAQWASTRPDVFPEDLCNVLASLQSGAPEHSFAFTSKQIEIELGAPVNKIFEYFSLKPIASGSIAQVYKVCQLIFLFVDLLSKLSWLVLFMKFYLTCKYAIRTDILLQLILT